jgi:hypothetical protein
MFNPSCDADGDEHCTDCIAEENDHCCWCGDEVSS